MIPPPPRSTLFPYTTLFRSAAREFSGRGTPPTFELVGGTIDWLRDRPVVGQGIEAKQDRKSTRLNSSHLGISYAVFCLKKKRQKKYDYARRHYELLCRQQTS